MIKTNILLNVEIPDEPNEAKLTAIKIDGNAMEFKTFAGFTAVDIYDLLFERRKNESDETC